MINNSPQNRHNYDYLNQSITIKYKVCNDFEESTTTVSNNESSKDPKDA